MRGPPIFVVGSFFLFSFSVFKETPKNARVTTHLLREYSFQGTSSSIQCVLAPFLIGLVRSFSSSVMNNAINRGRCFLQVTAINSQKKKIHPKIFEQHVYLGKRSAQQKSRLQKREVDLFLEEDGVAFKPSFAGTIICFDDSV